MLLLTPSRVLAGNLDAFYLSGDAAMQAGAITADARGGGATWYNPAGLAFLSGTRLDVSLNGYALRFGGTADFDPPTPDSEVTRLSRLDLNVVPTALTLTRRFGSIGVGIGAFVPSQSTAALRTQVVTPQSGEEPGVGFGYDESGRLQNYHLGAAAGWFPQPELALGASLLINYQTQLSTANLDLEVELPSGDRVASTTHYSLDTQRVGLELVLGGQWAITPTWDLGLVVRSPSLKLGEKIQEVETSQVASTRGTLETSSRFDDALAIGTAIISPFRFHAGLSHEVGEARWALEASLQLPLDDPGLGIELRPTWNARAGLRREMGPRWALGGGLFTDQSPNSEPDEFQENQLNFYGVTASLELGTPFGIHSKNGIPFEHPKVLIFGTTLSLSYALGVGSVARASVRPDSEGGVSLAILPTDVIAHELTLHLGSTVLE